MGNGARKDSMAKLMRIFTVLVWKRMMVSPQKSLNLELNRTTPWPELVKYHRESAQLVQTEP